MYTNGPTYVWNHRKITSYIHNLIKYWCPMIYFCSYIVPEYSFLDARGLGAYEGKKLDSVAEVNATLNYILNYLCIKVRYYFRTIFRYMPRIASPLTSNHHRWTMEHQTRAFKMCLFVSHNSCRFSRLSTPVTQLL